ncbi:MAG: XRE family transcriptional regulator [Chroococcidiopsis sp.]
MSLEPLTGNDLTDRIRLIAKEAGGNSKLARKIDSSESAIRAWIKGTSAPKYDSLVAIASAVDINLRWLMSGEGEMQGQNTSENERDDIAAQKARATKYLDLPAEMWAPVEHEFWTCEEANMEPTLHVGDVYIVIHKPASNGIYVLEIGGCKKAMRLAVVPDGIKCSNDNPLYKGADFTISHDSNDVRVIGRVLRAGNKQPA